MFVYLSKLLPLFIYPLGLAALLVLGVALLGHKRRWRRPILLLAFLLLWLGGSRWLAFNLAHSLESRYPPLTELPQAQAIVVLGGGTEFLFPPRTTVELNESGDRLLYAAWLYQQGVAEHLLVSGGTIAFEDGPQWPAEAEGMTAVLQIMGIPEAAIWLEPDSRNTYENALFSHALLAQKEIDEIVLVTSAIHMPRAVAIFEHQGFSVIPAPTDYQVTDVDWFYLWRPNLLIQLLNFMPRVEDLQLTTWALKEYIGLVVYGLRGWL